MNLLMLLPAFVVARPVKSRIDCAYWMLGFPDYFVKVHEFEHSAKFDCASRDCGRCFDCLSGWIGSSR